jgi:Membrane protein involved in colicin uptake
LEKATSTGLAAVHEGTEEGIHNEDMVRQSDLARARASDVAHAAKYSNVNQLACDIEENQESLLHQGSSSNGVPTTGKQWVAGMPPKDTTNVVGNIRMSPPVANCPQQPDAVAPSTKVTPTKGQVQQQQQQQAPPKSLSKKLNESGLDATAASTPSPAESPSVQGNASVMDRSLYFAHLVDDDDDSAVSGLTDIDCATVAEAEWKLTEFLRTETENIKKMLRNEPLDLEAVEEDDNYSIFTYNRSIVSGESDRVGKAAREAEEMVARMAEATAWMNDPTLLENETESDVEDDEKMDTVDGDGVRAEWTAYWSVDHQREYYYNFVTHQTCWTKPLDVDIDYSHVESARKSSNCSTASSHGSVQFQRNISVASPTKTIQSSITKIDSPPSDEKVAVKDFTTTNKNINKGPSPEALSVSKYTTNHAIKTLRPNNKRDDHSLEVGALNSPTASSVTSLGMSSRSSTTTSKVMQYRRKRAMIARRNRRIGFAILLALVAGIVFFYKKRETWLSTSSPNNTSIDATKKLELAKKLAAAEAERKRLLEQKRLEEEAKQRRLAEEAAAAEAQRKAQEEEVLRKKQLEEEAMRKKREEERVLQEKQRKAEEERKRQEDMQVTLLMEQEEERKQLQLLQEEMRRPWACNIPLTYLMSRKCWKVAKLNPIYDCKAIIDTMME